MIHIDIHKFRRTFCCILFLALPTFAAPAEIKNDELRKELLERARTDQDARRAKDKDLIRTVDESNTARLKEIVNKLGWPTQSLVGKDGESAAFLLVQHADRDKPFQVQALVLMEPLVKAGEVSPVSFAYLYDRTHSPQRFGTQGKCVGPGVWQPLEIEDVARVDERRSAAGIHPPSLEEYAKMVGTASCK